MIYTEEGPNIEGTWFGEWENIARVAKSANVSIFERKGYIFISFKSFLIRRDHCLQCYNVEIGGAEKQVHVKPAPAGQHRMQTSSICTSVNWSVFSCFDLYFFANWPVFSYQLITNQCWPALPNSQKTFFSDANRHCLISECSREH